MVDYQTPSTHSDETEELTKALINIATESWRFGKVVDRILVKLDPIEQARYSSQYRWYTRKIEEALAGAGMRVVNVEGRPFETGMAATPLNMDEFDPDDTLIVDQMIEPIIMSNKRLVKEGTILLRRGES